MTHKAIEVFLFWDETTNVPLARLREEMLALNGAICVEETLIDPFRCAARDKVRIHAICGSYGDGEFT